LPKGHANYHGVVALAGALPAAAGAALRLGEEFGGLLLDERLFQPGQNRARFGQGKPERVGS
jgi:hypothetical protein